MNVLKDMGKLISEKRKQAGLTQEALAEKLGITPQAVSKWENNVGLPDITLLPDIASVLKVSIDDMFKIKKQRQIAEFPKTLNNMDFICSIGNKACYSTKEVEKVDTNGKIYFKDGSIADIKEGFVINQGIGEIRFYETEEPIDEPHEVPKTVNETLEEFTSVSMTLSLPCEAKILKADNGIPKIEAQGNDKFMKFFKYSIHDGKLSIDINPTGNNNNSGNGKNEVTVYANFDKGDSLDITINGSAGVEIEPDFANSKIKINGSGDVSAVSTNTLDATINGSGDIDFDSVHESARITINGSGDISLETAKNVHAHINGSGDISIDTATGDLSTVIMGSGDMNIGGDVEKFHCIISGSGDIDASDLTVSEAEIQLSGSSDVTIGHVLKSSKEKISKESTLTVKQRG